MKTTRVMLFNAGYGGLTSYRASYAVLRQKYADRITDTPISELGLRSVSDFNCARRLRTSRTA